MFGKIARVYPSRGLSIPVFSALFFIGMLLIVTNLEASDAGQTMDVDKGREMTDVTLLGVVEARSQLDCATHCIQSERCYAANLKRVRVVI